MSHNHLRLVIHGKQTVKHLNNNMKKTMSPNIYLSPEELQYLVNACRNLPDEQKDDNIIDSLTEKFKKATRLNKISDLFEIE